MKQVFRIWSWELEDREKVSLVVQARPGVGPTLCRLLRTSFPKLVPVEQQVSGIAGLSGKVGVVLLGELPPTDEIAALMNLMKNVLTVCDDADVSHCLDLYRIPSDDIPQDEWPYTDTGDLVTRGKYSRVAACVNEVGKQLTLFAAAHPALRMANGVASIPSTGKHLDAPLVWRSIIARQFGIAEVGIKRVRGARPQKDITDRDERVENQRGSMGCDDCRGMRVLILDDLYMDGATMDEAVRAARSAGATNVFALCGVKTAKGTQGGVADLVLGGAEGVSFI